MTPTAGTDLGLHHLGLTVRDVQASARQYPDALGFEQVGGCEPSGGQRPRIFPRHRGLPVADRFTAA